MKKKIAAATSAKLNQQLFDRCCCEKRSCEDKKMSFKTCHESTGYEGLDFRFWQAIVALENISASKVELEAAIKAHKLTDSFLKDE